MTREDLQNEIALAVAAEAVGNFDEAERVSRQLLSTLSHRTAYDVSELELVKLQADATRILGVLHFRRGDYPQALEFLNEALQLSEKENDKGGLSKTLGNIGVVYRKMSNYPQALEFFTKALSLDEELGNKSGMIIHLGNIGLVHRDLSDFNSALQAFLKALSLSEELGNKLGIARQLGNIGGVHSDLSDYPKALEYLGQALSLSEEIGRKQLIATNLCIIGNVYLDISEYAKALENYRRALSIYEDLTNKSGIALVHGNIGALYKELSDYPQALEYYSKALNLAEELGDKKGAAIHLTNIGNVHSSLADYSKAMDYYGRALNLAEEVGNKSLVATNLGNIGTVYHQLADYNQALEYHKRALHLDEDLGISGGVSRHLASIGQVYAALADFANAQEFYENALAMRVQMGHRSEAAHTRASLAALYANPLNAQRDEQKAESLLRESIATTHELGTKHFEAHKTLAELCEAQKRWQEANREWKQYYAMKDEVQSAEAQKSAALIEQRRQIAEREKEIAIAKAAALAELKATRGLLDAVLPTSIATRMIAGEKRIADYFPKVSILFADIVGFTSIATEVPPHIVVDFLNHVFDVYDEIIKRHGCEKIKTIGDGYMAIAGAPTACEDHAERLARAAIEMQRDIKLPTEILDYLPNGASFSIRIGIHSGAAVCGVIGRERFVWDVYSDAVNTASRMESNGVAGKIHVSKDFAELIQNRQKASASSAEFRLEERGEIEIKGKGMMRTYFLGRA